jgi:hypothetical protein
MQKKSRQKPEEPPTLDSLVDEHEEEATVSVINKLLAVFDPGKICTLKNNEGRDLLRKDLRALQRRYEIDDFVVERMYRPCKSRYEPLPWEVGGKGASDRHDGRHLAGRSRSPRGSDRSSHAGRKKEILGVLKQRDSRHSTEHTIESSSEEHHSDEEVPYKGKAPNKRRTDLPENVLGEAQREVTIKMRISWTMIALQTQRATKEKLDLSRGQNSNRDFPTLRGNG